MATHRKRRNPVPTWEILISYSEYKTSGEPVADDEQADEYVSWYPGWIYLRREDAPWVVETLTVSFDPSPYQALPVVVARYDSYSTFLRAYGCWQIIGVCRNMQEAKDLQLQVHNGTWQGIMNWVGEGQLTSVEIHDMMVRSVPL